MTQQAIANTNLQGHQYRKGVTPIDGFKQALTAHGQGADVYHHILFTAGSALHGTMGGEAEFQAFRLQDWKQRTIEGRRESIAEVEDDDAGHEVGVLMFNAAMAGQRADYWKLKADIMQVLCGP